MRCLTLLLCIRFRFCAYICLERVSSRPRNCLESNTYLHTTSSHGRTRLCGIAIPLGDSSSWTHQIWAWGIYAHNRQNISTCLIHPIYPKAVRYTSWDPVFRCFLSNDIFLGIFSQTQLCILRWAIENWCFLVSHGYWDECGYNLA